MKLICTITGANVEAGAEAAKRLVASGCFRAEEAERQRPKRAVKKTSKKEA